MNTPKSCDRAGLPDPGNRCDYEIVDVFAATPGGGCAQAVVTDADELSTAQMAHIARELGTAETAFVLAPRRTGADYRVRVFTPDGESPHGGHSGLGTAVTLVRMGRLPGGLTVQQCGDSLLSLDVSAESGSIRARHPLPAGTFDIDQACACVGITRDHLLGGPATAGFGPAFHYLPVTAEAVTRSVPDHRLMAAAGLADLMVFHWDDSCRTATARLYAPGYAMPEDPACASACLGLAVWLSRAGYLTNTEGTQDFTLLQGRELGRPAHLRGTVHLQNRRVVGASVQGRVIPSTRGELPVPPGASN